MPKAEGLCVQSCPCAVCVLWVWMRELSVRSLFCGSGKESRPCGLCFVGLDMRVAVRSVFCGSGYEVIRAVCVL